MKKTFGEIYTFNQAAGVYLAKMDGKKNKLTYAIEKVGKKVESVFNEYNEAITDLEIDHAAVGEDGCLILDEKGGYKHTPQGQKDRNKGFKKLATTWENKEFEIEGYFVKEVPSNVSKEVRAVLEGFVIEPQLETA
jgi:hypothetical protein